MTLPHAGDRACGQLDTADCVLVYAALEMINRPKGAPGDGGVQAENTASLLLFQRAGGRSLQSDGCWRWLRPPTPDGSELRKKLPPPPSKEPFLPTQVLCRPIDRSCEAQRDARRLDACSVLDGRYCPAHYNTLHPFRNHRRPDSRPHSQRPTHHRLAQGGASHIRRRPHARLAERS